MIAFLDSTFTKSFALSLTFLFGASGLYPEKFKFTSRRWFCIGLIIWSLFGFLKIAANILHEG